jgi:hypothetical protein
MQANKTVMINGRPYDAVTGMPVEHKPEETKQPTESKRSAHSPAASVHSTAQRSQTLHRRAAKKSTLGAKRPQPGRHMDIARNANVSKFAKHPATRSDAAEKNASAVHETPKTHPVAARAHARVEAKQPKPVSATPKQIKEKAIEEAFAKATSKQTKEKGSWKLSRRFTVISAIFLVLIFAAYLTYLNMPSLSVGFASSQAGIKATYPEYRPDGYHLSQPVTYRDGEVTLKFSSNSGSGSYTIAQARSTWDSSAVFDNVVKKSAGDNYITTQERGLTIYSFDNKAVWVNGGILYMITTDAPLSGEQIRRIATSL